MRMFYSDLRGYAVWTEFAFFISLKHANRTRNECFKARREQIVQTVARAGYQAHISLFYLNHFLRPLQTSSAKLDTKYELIWLQRKRITVKLETSALILSLQQLFVILYLTIKTFEQGTVINKRKIAHLQAFQ
jgi:hypothetical protein